MAGVTSPAPTSAALAQRPLIAGLLVLVTAVAFEAQSVSTAMPAAAADLGQLDLYAWAFTAFAIPQIVAIVAGGRLCDRFGPVRPLQLGVLIFAAGVLLSALAVSMPMLLAGRFVQGLGGGLTNLALMVVVGRAFPPADTSRLMTYFSFAWMLPSFVGPGVAAWLVHVWSWHAVFWAVLPVVGLGVALLGPALAHRPLPGLGAAPAGTRTLLAGLGLAVGAAVVQAAAQLGSLWGIPLGVAGALLLVVGIPRLMPRGWRPLGVGLAGVIASRFFFSGAFSITFAFLPLMIVKLRGQELFVGGIALTVASFGWTFGSWVQSQRWLHLSRDRITTLGTALVTVGLSIVASGSFVLEVPVAVVIAGATIAGAGMGLAMPSTSILMIQLSPTDELGHNTSALQVAEALGNAVIVGAAGALFGAFSGAGDLRNAFGWAAALAAACAAASVAFSRRCGHVENLSARP